MNQQISYGYGLVTSAETPNYLIGRVLTIIEALGLKETQEKSVKDLLKNEVWSEFQGIGSKHIAPQFHDEIVRVVKEIEEKEKERHQNALIPSLNPDIEVNISWKYK